MLIKYPLDARALGAFDMVTANRKVTELQRQLQSAIQALLGAWQSQEGSPPLQAVLQLWADLELRRQMGKNLQQRVRRYYAQRDMVGAYGEIYRRCVAKAGGGAAGVVV